MSRSHRKIAGHLMVCLAVLAFGMPAMAQKEPQWSQIRGLAQLTATDKNDIRAWVDAQTKQILAETDPMKSRQLGRSFYTNIADSYNAGNASNSFKDTARTAVTESFVAQYKPPARVDAASPHPLGRLYVLMTIVTFKHPETLECFQKALADPASGVRERAATGLLQLRGQMSPAQWNDTLTLVKNAATGEANPVVLSRLYAILAVNQNQQADATMPIVLDILDARFRLFEQQWHVPQLADGEAVIWLATQFARINDQPTRKRIVLSAARLLADAVNVYAKQALKPSEKRSLEAAILATETQLKAMVNASTAPDISTIMIKGVKDQDKNAAMLAELDKWIGSAGGDGLLNGAPFNLPVGLGIERAPLPETRPAE